MALQRFVKRVVEREIFTPLISQAGLDAGKTSCRLNWGLPERPEVSLADVVRLAEVSATSGVQYLHPEEVRKMLVKMGFEITEP